MMTASQAKISRELDLVAQQPVRIQFPEESSGELHERLRSRVEANMETIGEPTRVITHSWLTADVSSLLGIAGAVAVSSSTDKHAFISAPGKPGVLPYNIFVGIRDGEKWMTTRTYDGAYQYRLSPLGRELTEAEKSAIYDQIGNIS